jgi:sRNA-binding protein
LKKKLNPRVQRLKAILQDAFPVVFPKDQTKIRPLAMTIDEQLFAWAAQQEGIEKKDITRTLQHYCARITYKRKLVTGTVRIHLSGEDAEPVTAEAEKLAAEQIAQAITDRRAKATLKKQQHQTQKKLAEQQQKAVPSIDTHNHAKKTTPTTSQKSSPQHTQTLEPTPKHARSPIRQAKQPDPIPIKPVTAPSQKAPVTATVIVKKRRRVASVHSQLPQPEGRSL